MRGLLVVVALALALPAGAGDLVAARTLRAGTVLSPEDMRPAEGLAAAAAADALAGLVGQELRRAVYVGQPIVSGDPGPPTLVRRNEIVTMGYSRGGLSIRTDGRALESGGEGQPIRVLNLVSRQAVVATVVGPNLVQVAP